jgi:hypothetical protein
MAITDSPELVNIKAQVFRLEQLQFTNYHGDPQTLLPIEQALALAYIARELSIANALRK